MINGHNLHGKLIDARHWARHGRLNCQTVHVITSGLCCLCLLYPIYMIQPV